MDDNYMYGDVDSLEPIPQNELGTLILKAKMYDCLEAVGVDSWEGYETAQELFNDLE